MNHNKIKIAKFVDNRIKNANKIVGGDSKIPGPGSGSGNAPVQSQSCPINCTCHKTQSDGCINCHGVSTGEGK